MIYLINLQKLTGFGVNSHFGLAITPTIPLTHNNPVEQAHRQQHRKPEYCALRMAFIGLAVNLLNFSAML
jgi:hypothetical protein